MPGHASNINTEKKTSDLLKFFGLNFQKFTSTICAAAVKIERPLLITLPLLTIFCTKRFRPLRFANDAKENSDE